MIEIKAVWQGWSGGPGYSTFHGLGSTDAAAGPLADALDDFFDSMENLLPTGLSIQIQPTWRDLDETTGALINEFSFPSARPVHEGSGNAAFSAVNGMCVNWLTGQSAGRKLRVGRTYLVPLTAFVWATDGTPNDSVVTQLQNAASALVSSGAGLAVWKRPRNGAGGDASVVTGARVPDEGVILRSRRR